MLKNGKRNFDPNAPRHFYHDGFHLNFCEMGQGEPILLLHGFASNFYVNWMHSGWMQVLVEAGYHVITYDLRGHGKSDVSHDKSDYHPWLLAADSAALLRYLKIEKAHIMGYAMGAKVAAFMARNHSERVNDLVLGGLGDALIRYMGFLDPIVEALEVDDIADVTTRRMKMFRAFADYTKSDRLALSACVRSSRDIMSKEDAEKIDVPILLASGSKDHFTGSVEPLLDLFQNAEYFSILGRDHMLSIGDLRFKRRVLSFLTDNPIL